MKTRLFLVRHGEPDLPGASSLFLGQSDIPLSSKGEAQIETLKKHLEEVPFRFACCSDLRRTLETARILLDPHPCPLSATPALREVALGAWELCPREEIALRHPEAYAARGRDLMGFRPPGGESLRDVEARALPYLESVMETTGGDVLVVTHAGVLRLLLRRLLDLSYDRLFSFRFDYGSLSVLQMRTDGPEILRLNWTPLSSLNDLLPS